jgi:hypothetical protein
MLLHLVCRIMKLGNIIILHSVPFHLKGKLYVITRRVSHYLRVHVITHNV